MICPIQSRNKQIDRALATTRGSKRRRRASSYSLSMLLLQRCTTTWLTAALVVPCFFFTRVLAESSSNSNSNYNPYQYDQTFPQFTPDGRLLQLEYARSAADHSAPIWAVPLQLAKTDNVDNSDNGDSETTTTTSSSTSTENDVSNQDTNADTDDFLLAILTYRPSTRVQNRLHIIYETTARGTHHSSTICLGLAGILADGTALQQSLMEDCVQHARLYGTSWTTGRQWAQAASQLFRSLKSGLRPWGASALVVQMDHDDHTKKQLQLSPSTIPSNHNQKKTHPLSLYITDPSGAIRSISGAELLFNQQPAGRPYHLLGGGSSAVLAPSTLQRLERAFSRKQPQQQTTTWTLADQLAEVVDALQSSILLQQQQLLSDDDHEAEDTTTTRREDEQDLSWEIVLVSGTKGITKLTPRQSERFNNATAE